MSRSTSLRHTPFARALDRRGSASSPSRPVSRSRGPRRAFHVCFASSCSSRSRASSRFLSRVVAPFAALSVFLGFGDDRVASRAPRLLAFESGTNAARSTFGDAFWFSLSFDFSQHNRRQTPRSRSAVASSRSCLFFVGLSTFALFTSSVSAAVLHRLKNEGAAMDWEDLEGALGDLRMESQSGNHRGASTTPRRKTIRMPVVDHHAPIGDTQPTDSRIRRI